MEVKDSSAELVMMGTWGYGLKGYFCVPLKVALFGQRSPTQRKILKYRRVNIFTETRPNHDTIKQHRLDFPSCLCAFSDIMQE